MPVIKFGRYVRRGLLLPAIAGLALGGLVFALFERGDASKTEAGQTGAQIQSRPGEAGAGSSGRGARVGEAATPGMRVRVIDGDTIEDTATGERVRLQNIDTPETGERAQCRAERQAGEAATGAARSIVSTGAVTVRRTGRKDQYGRTIGLVFVDGRDLGVTLMERGLARPWRGRREAWCAPDGSLLPAR